MYMMVGSTPGSDWRFLLPVLKELGCGTPSEETVQEWQTSLSAGAGNVRGQTEKLFGSAESSILLPISMDEPGFPLQRVLDHLERSVLLLFYTRPEPALVRAMVEGMNPAHELEKWRNSAGRILDIYRANQKRTVIMSAETALASPAEFDKVCREYVGADGGEVAVLDVSVPERKNDFHSLIAAQMVVQSRDVGDLLNELEASSIPLGQRADIPDIDCEKIYLTLEETRLKQAMELESLENKCHDLQEENDVILLQLHEVQEELESYYLEARREAEKRIRVESEFKRQADRMSATAQRMETELANTKKALASKEKELALSQETVTMILRSSSWRLTRPLRVLRRALTGRPLR